MSVISFIISLLFLWIATSFILGGLSYIIHLHHIAANYLDSQITMQIVKEILARGDIETAILLISNRLLHNNRFV